MRKRPFSLFGLINYFILTLFGFAMIYPFIYILVYSLNDGKDSMMGALYFFRANLRWKIMWKCSTTSASGRPTGLRCCAR
ncbi:hypothetical protein PACILC2_14170 [Paenibacillus cisolokensis]|uniref:ABC transmembrane type-1 domain-containing protein n=1 Tax=Paenibacillus cisolokensis TaxID=1658519 RepID=A0ABQ4N3Y1_9BACL|nr:hypothetical protein [Paenibacillus cisolokensis]GIQ62849.1 hypothetical protein PACILC2_14170 [Paenibacillus cisolokensis]